jgi:pantoate--beta-alanine ligase
LAAGGFEPDYVNICEANTLNYPNGNDNALVILAAARLGRARLIDNVDFTIA